MLNTGFISCKHTCECSFIILAGLRWKTGKDKKARRIDTAFSAGYGIFLTGEKKEQ